MEQATAPYQILLDEDEIHGERNAIWAPADVESIVRAGFRFKPGEPAECRIAEDEWVRCTVMGTLYREPSWPEGQFAPYQVRIDDALPGALDDRAHTLAAAATLIWVPRDVEETIRPVCTEREERLVALVRLRESGVVSAEEYQEKRRSIIHSRDPSAEL